MRGGCKKKRELNEASATTNDDGDGGGNEASRAPEYIRDAHTQDGETDRCFVVVFFLLTRPKDPHRTRRGGRVAHASFPASLPPPPSIL